MMRLHLMLIASLLLAHTLPAWAQKRAPGLWEQSITIKSGDGPAENPMAKVQEMLAKMPPKQRQAMEQQMAQSGSSLPTQGNAVRVCVTPEMAARSDMPQHEGNCTQDSVQRSGNTVRFKFTCTGARPSTGEGEMTFASDKAYTGKTTVNRSGGGKAERMEMQHTGKWLAADCGDVKPRISPSPRP